MKNIIKNNKLKLFIQEIILFISSINILNEIKNINPKFIFFSEDKSYQKYSRSIIDIICSKYPDKIYYLSIHKDDFIQDKNIKNFYISPFLLKFFFNNVKADNLFLTLTDLGNHFINKTKNIRNYIYYFHSPISTTKSYTPKAFDNYDVIMCNGQFQINEIKSREEFKNLKKKKLIPTGYFYFDHLIENISFDAKGDYILIAPSWNKNAKHLINENFIELIDVLLKKNFKVIFRPHPEHFKRSKIILDKIKANFTSEAFCFDEDFENIKSMEKSRCLITDNSGIAIEYMIALKKPVLYLNEIDKIHNSEFQDYAKLMTIDQTIKEKFGYIFDNSDFQQIEVIIKNSEDNFNKKLTDLEILISKNYFNFGKTKDFLSSNLSSVILN